MNDIRKAVRSLTQFNPPPAPRYGVATRAALAISVPFAILALLGYPEIGLQAAAGAFTALYAASATVKERAKVLPFVGVGLLVCAGLGVLLATWQWAFAAGLVIIAVLAATLCLAFRVGPPGPVFFVLMYGLSGNITSVTDGVRDTNPIVFLLALTTGVVFSYLVAIAPLVIPRVRREPAARLADLLPGPWLERGEGTLIFRIGIAALIGTVLSILWLDPVHAYWTVTASVAVVGLTATRSYAIGRGMHRMLGTVLGAGCYMLFVPLGTEPWVLIPLLAALQFTIELLVVRNYAVALIFVTPLVLLITSAATGEPNLMGTALERVVDTIAGALLAMATSFMHRK